MYGHGTQNCHRRSSCTQCASSDHNQLACPLKQLAKDASPVFKCSYCTKNNIQPTNHRASDVNCPECKTYIDSRKSVSVQHQNSKAKQREPVKSQDKRTNYIPAPITTTTCTKFQKCSLYTNNDQQYHQNNPNKNNNTDEDLFSTTELFKIFTNAIQDIKNCRTKLDQIQVMANLINHVLQ